LPRDAFLPSVQADLINNKHTRGISQTLVRGMQQGQGGGNARHEGMVTLYFSAQSHYQRITATTTSVAFALVALVLKRTSTLEMLRPILSWPWFATAHKNLRRASGCED